MRYIVCEKPGQFALKEKEPPSRNSGEALLKIKQVGICGTDLHAYTGNQAFFSYPRILGHELCAEIIEVDHNEKNLKAGDKVVVMPYVSCGTCIACRKKKTNCCSNIQVLGVHTDGGMQELISVSVDLLLPVNQLSDDQVAVVEPLAIAAHALNRAQVKTGETIAVMGCGPIGLGILKQGQIRGANVIAIDINPDRLRFAQEKLGCDHTVDANAFDPVSQVAEITGNDMCTAVFDATGAKIPLENGPKYMSHGGRYVLVGLSKGDLTFLHPDIHAKETTLMCSRNATMDDFEQVIETIDQFPVESFVTHKVSFTEMIEQFDSWTKPNSGTIKALVSFDQ